MRLRSKKIYLPLILPKTGTMNSEVSNSCLRYRSFLHCLDFLADEDGFAEFGRGGDAEDADILPGASKRRRLGSNDDGFGDEPIMDEFGAPADEGFGLDEGVTNLMEEDEERDSDAEENGFHAPASPTRKAKTPQQAFDAASDITESTVVQGDKERFVLGPLDNAAQGKLVVVHTVSYPF